MSDNENKASRSTPTERMLNLARSIANDLQIGLPEEVEQSFDACRDFIDENLEKVPPTEKQLAYANRIAETQGAAIPDDVITSKNKLSKWLDQHGANRAK